jgi:hemoglobin-like flavoprotein
VILKGHALVAWSWALIRPESARVADLFYENLFEMAPATRALFASTDMAVQRVKFIAMLDAIVASLEDPDWLVRNLGPLGQRHASYRVQASHYDVVRDALLLTLSQALGDVFDAEAREAWSAAYTVMAALMTRGAADG